MLSKPISLSPDSQSISIKDNTITFTAQISTNCALEMIKNEDGTDSEFCYVSLIISTNDQDYIFSYDSDKEKENDYQVIKGLVIKGKHCNKIEITLDLSKKAYGFYSYYSYYNDTPALYPHEPISNKTYGEIITNNNECRWKIRLYHKNSLLKDNQHINGNIVAYGSITDTSNTSGGKRLKINPHVNIYDYVFGKQSYYVSQFVSEEKGQYIVQTLKEVVRNLDSNMRFYITVKGRQFPIKYYRFFASDSETDIPSSDRTGHFYTNDFDGYGNPIAGYATIDKNSVAQKGDTYSISCNYIDSSIAYFKINEDPIITVTNNKGDTLNEENSSKGNPYILNYCNLELLINYEQAENIEPNYYSYKVYNYDLATDSCSLEYSSGNIYNQDIICSYDSFLHDNYYKIIITIIDLAQRTYEKEFYFKAKFSDLTLPIYAKAEYYSDHNSVIVDWSGIKSINPAVKNDNYKFTKVNSAGELDDTVLAYNALHIAEKNSITYSCDDFGNNLLFHNSVFGLTFKGDNSLNGNIAELHTNNNSIQVSYDGENLYVKTTNYTAKFKLYGDYDNSLEFLENKLSSAELSYDIPYSWNDELSWDESKDHYWHEENIINRGIWVLIADENQCFLKNIYTDSSDTVLEKEFYPIRTGDSIKTPAISKLTLYGEVTYLSAIVINQSDLYDDRLKTTLFGENPVQIPVWNWFDGTQLLCNFENNLNGATFNQSLQNIVGYKLYKTMGNSKKLYEIGNIKDPVCRVAEDFAVGDNCKYCYYIYPLIKSENSELLTVQAPIKTNDITLHYNTDKVFGLVEKERNIYEVDLNTVWRLYANLDDPGFILNNDKTFYDSLSTFSQEYVGNRRYISKSISALIGVIDCSSDKRYHDDYDMLISWNDFCTSSQLKCFVDLRGLILPGNFEANVSAEYMQAENSPITSKFNWRQKSDLSIIKIYATPLPFNPINNEYLYGSDNLSLEGNDIKLLTGER